MRSFPASLRGPVERCELRRAASSRWGVRQVDLRKDIVFSMQGKLGAGAAGKPSPREMGRTFTEPTAYHEARVVVKSRRSTAATSQTHSLATTLRIGSCFARLAGLREGFGWEAEFKEAGKGALGRGGKRRA